MCEKPCGRRRERRCLESSDLHCAENGLGTLTLAQQNERGGIPRAKKGRMCKEGKQGKRRGGGHQRRSWEGQAKLSLTQPLSRLSPLPQAISLTQT